MRRLGTAGICEALPRTTAEINSDESLTTGEPGDPGRKPGSCLLGWAADAEAMTAQSICTAAALALGEREIPSSKSKAWRSQSRRAR